jgi:hypothetical protein
MPDSSLSFRRLIPAALAVAGTYAYFLIFPQFAFLHALRAEGLPVGEVRILMGLMAVGGVTASLAAGRLQNDGAHRRWMHAGAAFCALAAALFVEVGPNPGWNHAVALTTGLGLGLLTVSLAASLRGLAGAAGVAIACGGGTGLAYGLVNLPPVFNATPAAQATISLAAAALVSAALLVSPGPGADAADVGELKPAGYRLGVGLFLILIWLDSACFAIIQETDVMRHASWGRSADLVCNALVHLFFALVAGLFFRPRHLVAWLTAAVVLLIAASWLLDCGGMAATRAHPLYASGVSVYSTLLVAWLPLAHGAGCAGRVAALYAIAGWTGSALGIGMALDLHRIPGGFLALAAGVFALAIAAGAGRLTGGRDHA